MSSTYKLTQQITVDDIEALLLLRSELKLFKEKADQLKEHLDELESEILLKIDMGFVMACSDFKTTVKETSRKFPSWKDCFLSYAGKDEADKVISETPQKIYRSLLVERKVTHKAP